MDKLGFRSPFILAKVGYKLGQPLGKAAHAELPQVWLYLAEEIEAKIEHLNTLQLGRYEYRIVDNA
ncbi:hypothetical protein ACFPQ7_13180 [Methylobacterium iners]|uniref:Uncharacterized protein n=2 Tax=Methylobacterium iners TaxID=418707 RepID=A0ABQ4S3Q8_9HYPH|nr:hypothetical protein OCOJLMKI_3761 [Methylobacterium iners]